MLTILVVLHVFICVLLIVTVLLQFGKGAEVGAVMGGSGGASQAIFSSSAKGNFMTKATTVLAIGFMVNSIALTILKSKSASRSLFDNEAPVAAPLNSDVQALDNKGAVEGNANPAGAVAGPETGVAGDAPAETTAPGQRSETTPVTEEKKQ